MKTPATPFRIGRGSAIASDKWQVQDPPSTIKDCQDHRHKTSVSRFVFPRPPSTGSPAKPRVPSFSSRSLWILDDRKDAAAGP